jgi:peptidoglycan/xylan/chitin deacetylase (PgdA/CDA1 family)
LELLEKGTEMKLRLSWIKYLTDFRGEKLLNQAMHMFRLHAVPFGALLQNMFNVLERHQAKFTFPLVASVASKNVELTREILGCGHEVAVHGFNHVNYSYITERQQDEDMKRALDAYDALGIKVCGFRAPYNIYTDASPKLVEKYGFLWDIGMGFNQKYRGGNSLFRVPVGDHESSFVCVPLNRLSDDYMIDIQGLSNYQMEKKLKHAIKGAREKGGVIMFDLHPIRMGQTKYITVLNSLVKYGTELGGWFPTVTEAVNYWNKHGNWKDDAPFCCLLTGDIDNYTFFDYLQRLF